MEATAREALTIDELARVTGVTVRNIRAHQSRGLLPPPEVRGRTGYYCPDHVARLQLIGEMQADGFNLAAIKRLLEAPNGTVHEALEIRHTLLRPFEVEEPEVLTRAQIVDRVSQGVPSDDDLARSIKFGLLRDLGGDRYEVRSPTLFRAATELAQLGVSQTVALDVLEQIKTHSEAIADSFVRLLLDEVLFKIGEEPTEKDLAMVREAIERLRPLASESVVATFRQTMTRAIEQALADIDKTISVLPTR